jgi:aryl-alcohol dehydrogenase-like predicted oxidoreductase
MAHNLYTIVVIPMLIICCHQTYFKTPSEFYGPSNEDENLTTLNHAIDIGMTFIDTADMYGTGQNELLLSKVLKTRRSEVFLCTKVGECHWDGRHLDTDHIKKSQT